ncbi:7715_t:CDS:2 [Ambispora leptoticha]|uniref:7715_t:CDS:1 n=1 Tax=Ambispora leptoticha TaxID=144679 RepID=A0A9N9BC93_9GLOM|nr:7715_t:CDS:2 [Ambispora leptoticha]
MTLAAKKKVSNQQRSYEYVCRCFDSQIVNSLDLIDFLRAEGVLVKDENRFKMSSVLSLKYITNLVIQFFDQDIISGAFYLLFKIVRDVYVNGYKNQRVPRESVYDTEMHRILINWISKQRNFKVTCKWHKEEHCANEKDKHTCSDIVMKTPYQKIVLDLATKTQLDAHFVRALEYGNKLSAEDVWIVHSHVRIIQPKILIIHLIKN